MSNKKRGLVTLSLLAVTSLLISACERSLSQAPVVTPTLIATGLFVSPFPSAENPLDMIAEFAKQTSAAQTIAAGGVVVTGTPGTPTSTTGSETPGTPLSITNTPGVPTVDVSTPTNANAVATTAIPTISAVNSTPVPAGVRPASYNLQSGEFPWCIARRFNVNPEDLLSLSGLVDGLMYPAGTLLKIPQSGAFPGSRSLIAHPATYSVTSSDETLYSIACMYGDVDPGAIAFANGISTGSVLSVGQQIKIP